jgi:uncharacterized membrane protein YbhN (UPF0104 family)
MSWRPVARLVFGAAVLGAVILALDPAQVADALAAADLRLAIPAVLALTLMHAVVAAGWRWLIRERTGVRLSWPSALRAHYAAQALGSITPGNLGADIQRAAAVRAAGHSWPAAVEPIIVQRATSYLALGVLAAIGLWILSSTSELGQLIVLIGVVVAAGLVAVAWLLMVPIGPLKGVHAWLRQRVGASLEGDGAGASTAAGPAWRLIAGGVANGLVFHAGSIGLTWLLVLTMDPSSATWPMLAALSVARLSLAVPLSPGGVGVQEGTLVALLAGMHLAPQAALAAMLFARMSTLLLALVGVGLMTRGTPPLASVRSQVRAATVDHR